MSFYSTNENLIFVPALSFSYLQNKGNSSSFEKEGNPSCLLGCDEVVCFTVNFWLFFFNCSISGHRCTMSIWYWIFKSRCRISMPRIRSENGIYFETIMVGPSIYVFSASCLMHVVRALWKRLIKQKRKKEKAGEEKRRGEYELSKSSILAASYSSMFIMSRWTKQTRR